MLLSYPYGSLIKFLQFTFQVIKKSEVDDKKSENVNSSNSEANKSTSSAKPTLDKDSGIYFVILFIKSYHILPLSARDKL